MIIVKFCSGIGNQLYQYAVYLYLQKKYPNVTIKADISAFEDDIVLNKGNGFSYGFGIKDFFGIDIPYASSDEIERINYEIQFGPLFRKILPRISAKYVGNSLLAKVRGNIIPKYKRLKDSYITNIPFSGYNGNIGQLDINHDYYLNGLWQNYEYIRLIERDLRESLTLKVEPLETTKMLLEKIDNTNSVCIHIRRGNFTIAANKYSHDICGKKYYQNAIQMVKSRIDNPHFFVFSDDILYCKDMLDGLENVIFVSGSGNFSLQEEMLMISRCKSAIIPNSTFAFWCVWMTNHDNKIVVAPKYSVREKNIWHRFSVPENWIIIDNLLEGMIR